jgi:hypothetical protein
MVVHVAGGFAGRGEIRRRLAGWQATAGGETVSGCIQADGDLSATSATGETAELYATNAKCKTFVRYTRFGLVLVRSWYDQNSTEVQAVVGTMHYRQWYHHGVITTRAAALYDQYNALNLPLRVC